jgi:diguanylate cyclase
MTMQIRAKPNFLFAQWLILGLALLTFGGAIAFSLYQERDRTESRERDRLLAQGRVIQENVSQTLLSVSQVLMDIRTQLPTRGHESGFNSYLKTLTDAMPGVRTLLILDADGNAYAANRPELTGKNFSHRVYFQEPRQHPDADLLYVSPPYHTSLGIFAISVSRMIPGARGKFAGIVTATLDPAYFAPLLDSVRYAPDMGTAIVHWEGTRFVMQPLRKDAVEKNLIQPGSFFLRHRQSGQEATVFSGTVYATGEERMMAQRTINPADLKMDRPLVVAVSRKLDGIYATWHHDAQVLGWLYGLISVVSMLGLYAYQRKQREFAWKEAKAVRTIEASDRFMRTIADHIPGMVAYWTYELRCRFSNAAYLEWFGKTPEQMRGIRIQDLMDPQLFEQNAPFIRAALSGAPQQFERILTKADGSTGYTWIQYIPDQDGDRVKGFVVLVSDITKFKEAEIARAESEWKLKTIIEAEPECVTVLAADGTLQQMNRAGLDMIGADSEEQIIGCVLADMVESQYQQAFIALNVKVNEGESGVLAFQLIGLKGIRRWLESHAVPMRDRNGHITGSLCVIRDITDRKKVEQELEQLAQTDFLTGLPNRRYFMTLAEQELSRTIRYGGPLAVLMMDIDHFKKINDTYGHKMGDIVLQTLADLYRGALRNIDIVGRIGGEEFAAVLPQTDGKSALELAERLRQIIAQAEVPLEHGVPIHFTMSIGVASYVGASSNIDTLLSRADEALYEAKNSGRNKVCAYKNLDA